MTKFLFRYAIYCNGFHDYAIREYLYGDRVQVIFGQTFFLDQTRYFINFRDLLKCIVRVGFTIEFNYIRMTE